MGTASGRRKRRSGGDGGGGDDGRASGESGVGVKSGESERRSGLENTAQGGRSSRASSCSPHMSRTPYVSIFFPTLLRSVIIFVYTAYYK